MTTKGYPKEINYRRLQRFLDPCFPLLLGLGQTSPWSIEAVPPAPDLFTFNLNEIFIYFPIPIRKAAIQKSSATQDTVVIDGKHILLMDDPTILDIRREQISKLYLEVKLPHNQIPEPAFRSLGVFIIHSVVDIESIKSRCYASYLPSDINAIPLYYENFSPIEVQEDVEQTFKLIIEA
jgi:hypothetical protein